MSRHLDEEILDNIYSEAKKCEEDGFVDEALSLYKDAYELQQSDVIKSAIERLSDLLNTKLASNFDKNLHLKETSHLQSTPYSTQVDDRNFNGPSDLNLSTVTPIRSAFKNKQVDISMINQSSNMTIAMQEGEKSFNAGYYNQLILEARSLYKDSNQLEEALSKYEEAHALHQDVKLYKRILKIHQELKARLVQSFVETSAKVSNDREDMIEMYNNLVIDAKAYIESGNKAEALEMYQQAYKIDPSEKLSQKIAKLTEELENVDESTDQLDVEQYNSLIRGAKLKLSEEDYHGALLLYENANELNPSEKLQKRINKIKDFIENEYEEEGHSSPTSDCTPKNDKDLNKSVMKSEVDEYCHNLVKNAKKWEESNQFNEAVDAYREAQNLKPCPYFVAKIKELEEKLVINEDNSTGPELDIEHYNKLIIEGREFLNDGNLQKSLELYKEAHKLNPLDKLAKRIEKIEQKLSEVEEEEGDEQEVDSEIKEYYDVTVADAEMKEHKLLFDEAIALYEEANELIPSNKIVQKIANLEFKRDSDKENIEESKATVLSLNDLLPKDKVKYNELVTKGRYAQKESKIEKALNYYRKASQIYKNLKLSTRISKLEKFLEEEAENENLYTDIGDGFFLTNEIHDKLYEYQREGVKWMWELYKAEHGGILGDDMGLGKTIQTIVFLQAMFIMEEISTAMLVMPLSLINNWQEEFNKWAPEIRVELFHGSKAERERNVKRVIKKGGVILTTYGIIEKNVEFLVNTSFKWDYLCLDEGHKIKNPTKTSKAMRNVPCSHRLIISGTPIQNNLKELWALFDFVSRGKLLGTMTMFKMNYITPIERGREKDASKAEAKLGARLAENLRKLIDPFFLRRTKQEIKKRNVGQSTDLSKLGKKNELCVWLQLSDGQHNLYKAFLTLDTVRDAMNQSRSPLAALTVLKKICDHPRLAIKFEALKEVMDADSMNMKADDHRELLSTVELPKDPSHDMLLSESCKLKFALGLLELLSSTGHRTLLFSTSLKILDYIQSMIGEKGLRCLRIDGTVNKRGDRQAIIDTFNTDMRFSVFLLTTQVGGVGLNLTSADRVIIYDPNWNPATDAQAVDRAYRIGQTKPVIVYRLLTSGTIEEKIYRKQVFKDSITRQATGDSFDPIRYFTNQEISQLFLLGCTTVSETWSQLEVLHGAARDHSEQLKSELKEITGMGALACSDHDLLFSHEEVVENTPEERKFVDERVEQAKRNLALDTAGGPVPYQHYTAPVRDGPDPRTTAVPLSGGMRAPWEPTRGHSMWNNREADVESVRGDIERVEIRESPYFAENQSPMEGKLHEPEPTPHRPEVITIEDDEVEVREEQKKLSLSDYKKRQTKIYDFVDSPVQQPHHSIRPGPNLSSPVRMKNVVKRNVVTPRKSLSNPVGLIIDNHIQNTPKKTTATSDDELEEDLESSRYDALNKPPCLDESVEDENDGEEQEEEGEEEEYRDEDNAGAWEEQPAQIDDDDSSEDEEEREESNHAEEKKEKVDKLANMMNTFKLNSPQSSPKGTPEETVQIKRFVTRRTDSTNNYTSDDNPAELDVRTPDIRNILKHPRVRSKEQAEEKEEARSGSKEQAEEKQEENKENKEVESKKSSTVSGGCTCGRLQSALDKGYKVTKCVCMCTPTEEDKYNRYLARGLEHHKSGNAGKALQYYKAALQYRNDDTTVQKAYLTLKKQLKRDIPPKS